MQIDGVFIENTFAEAFAMRRARLVVTAQNERWARIAASEATGFATSIIACDVEAGLERQLAEDETPDGRPGVALLFFGFSAKALEEALVKRIGQCVLTCPTTAIFDGWRKPPAEASEPAEPDPQEIALGKQLRYFGDGMQRSKVIGERRYWRIPVMEGEFVVEEKTFAARGIAGGNFLLEGRTQTGTLHAAERAVSAIAPLEGVITPFPGGLARSGSKVGSRYKALRASTNEAYCPTLRDRVETQLHPEASCVYEVIINGTHREAIERAIATGVRAACEGGAADGLVAISAGNYGGNLGKFHFRLHDVLQARPAPP